MTKAKSIGIGAAAARVLLVLIVLPLFGTVALMLIEGWGFLDALYMSVITLSTVGYEEVHPLSAGGRVFVIGYLVLGLGIFLFGVAYMGELLLQAQLTGFLDRKRMGNIIKTLTHHHVVCGFGRVGRRLCMELAESDQAFVVIDRDPAAIDAATRLGYAAICGDATEDSVLEAARLDLARGLAVVMPNDADNLYVVLAARLERPRLQILARATDERSQTMLLKAGANRVVDLYETGAQKMAQLLTNPNVEDFMQILTSQGNRLELAEIGVIPALDCCGKTLDRTDFRERGIIVVAHQKPGSEFVLPPESTAMIEEGDTLIAFGDAESIKNLLVSE
jgi:voltage-gated potassium channel